MTGQDTPAALRFDACVKLILVSEGGNDDDARDPGGRTSRGITQREYDVWRYHHAGLPSDVWHAPQQTVLDIYQQNYWNAVRGDDLPAGVDYCVFDCCVLQGIGRAIPWLQHAVNTPADGVIGPLTLAAVKNAEHYTTINRYQDTRLEHLRSLSIWSTFGRGWKARMDRVRRDAVAMAQRAEEIV